MENAARFVGVAGLLLAGVALGFALAANNAQAMPGFGWGGAMAAGGGAAAAFVAGVALRAMQRVRR